MRKTLARIVRETAPTETQSSPFSQETVSQIQTLFKHISERERELAKLDGVSAAERPYFGDERPATQKVNVVPLQRPAKDRESN